MKLVLARCEVRSWQHDDLGSLVKYADNRKIWLNLRDRFPHPYTRQAGRDFLRITLTQRPETLFAIAVGGEAVGGIGFVMMTDVERVSAEIGYWLPPPLLGTGHCERSGCRGHAIRDRDVWSHTRVRRAVCVKPRVRPRAREGGLRAR